MGLTVPQDELLPVSQGESILTHEPCTFLPYGPWEESV